MSPSFRLPSLTTESCPSYCDIVQQCTELSSSSGSQCCKHESHNALTLYCRSYLGGPDLDELHFIRLFEPLTLCFAHLITVIVLSRITHSACRVEVLHSGCKPSPKETMTLDFARSWVPGRCSSSLVRDEGCKQMIDFLRDITSIEAVPQRRK